ncbi:MAG: S-layer homology domain-containing protein [Oscillospiraceae bacterium]|nr:S-layer homology domain-containing protein [Oscillospiraceae bacterium]
MNAKTKKIKNKKSKTGRKLLSYIISALLIFSAFVPVILSPLISSAEIRQISFDTVYQDSMTTASSTNLYYFDTTVKGSVSIKFETAASTKTNSWRISLMGVSDSTLYAMQDFGSAAISSGATTRIEYTDYINLPAGSYYIWVYVPVGATLVTNSYKISVSFSLESGGSSTNPVNPNPTNPSGSNNTIQTATFMNLNTTMTGNLKSAADLNYYKITVPYHGSINLSFSVGSAIDSGNWVILLYDKNEKQLQMSRVGSGGEVINLIRTNKLDKLRLPPGEYYIKIAAYSSSSASNANYTVYADYSAERSSRYEREFNDTRETATNILINAAVIGNLSSASDRDYFKFSVSEHNDLRIEFSTPDTINQDMWTIYLQDSKGGVKTYSAGGSGEAINGKRTFVSENLTLDQGEYYIVVYPYSVDSTSPVFYSNSDYSLLVHSDSAPVPEIFDDEYIYPTETPSSEYNVNKEISGQIKNAGDVNNFDFGLNYSGSVTVDFISPNNISKQAWILNIFDKNNRLLYSGKYGDEGTASYSSGTKAKTSDKIRVPAGSYYVQVLPVNAYDFSTASYRIRINYSPEAKESLPSYSNSYFNSNIELFELYETEYNNTPHTANNLNLGLPLIGNMSDYNDIDYFKFTLTQNGSVAISFETLKSISQNNWIIELFSSDMATESIYKDYFGADGESESSLSEYKTKTSKNMRLQPGTYYIKISAYNIINYSNTDYKIKIEFNNESSGNGLYETEPNNSPETANLLPFNTDITGDIFNINDIDYFKIAVNKSQDIQIKFSVNAHINDSFWSVKLYDAYHRELKSYKIGGDGGVMSPSSASPSSSADLTKYFKTDKTYLIPGDYYVSVSAYSPDEYSNEDYILKVLDEAGQKIETFVYPEDKPSEWALFEVGYAYGYNLIPLSYMKNFKNAIKREEFCMLIIKFLEVAEDKDISEILAEKNKTTDASVFTDTSDPYILAAYSLGLVNGRGNGIFDPDGNITREEAATMLMRVGVFENININAEPLNFNDDIKFNTWSVNAITYVSGCMDSRGNRIMNGYTDGEFHPKDTYSREQAFMTIFRLYALKTGV